ncbi:MAG TPA: DoxX family protein [Aldersonia sp.]
MQVVAIVCSVVLAVAALAYGIPKVQSRSASWAFLRSRGLSGGVVRAMGIGELLAVIGLMAGLFWVPAGVLASGLLVLLYGWGVAFHLMYGDFGSVKLRGTALLTLSTLALALLTLCVFLISL